MKVTIIKKRYKLPNKESWNLQIDDRYAELRAWRREHQFETNRTWIRYSVNAEAAGNLEFIEHAYLPYYIELDEQNPTKSIAYFYKLLMLQ